MSGSHDSSTSITFMGRLRMNPDDPAVRSEFFERYGRRLHAWCKGFGLQEADAEDVQQEVVVKLLGAFQKFEYDPSQSLRGFLRTVARNVWHTWVQNQQRQRAATSSEPLEVLNSVPAREDLLAKLDEEFDKEILDLAMVRVQFRVKPHNWTAFVEVVLKGRPPEEVAASLNMKRLTLYPIVARVKTMMKEEIQKLRAREE